MKHCETSNKNPTRNQLKRSVVEFRSTNFGSSEMSIFFVSAMKRLKIKELTKKNAHVKDPTLCLRCYSKTSPFTYYVNFPEFPHTKQVFPAIFRNFPCTLRRNNVLKRRPGTETPRFFLVGEEQNSFVDSFLGWQRSRGQ